MTYPTFKGPPRMLDHHEQKRLRQRTQLAAMRDAEAATEAPETLAALVAREMAKGTADGLRYAGLALLREAERVG